MKQVDMIIKSAEGLHARPAMKFVNQASKFKAKIDVIKDNKTYSAKSMISVLSMGAVQGEKITIIIDGEDESEAMNSLQLLLMEECV
ncbi:MAG: phosphocarrier protein HPr [Firmicutes bacterium]|nr:phosphocarrier protein HPr [Bacillota bacterium]